MASENESLKVGDREAFEKWMNREPTWVDYNSDARYMAWEAALEYERSRHRIPPAQAESVKVKRGMRLLIEATVGEEYDENTCDLQIHTGLPVDAWVVAKLSQLRPLPVTQELTDASH